MRKRSRHKLDSGAVGLFFGLFLPILLFLLVYLWKEEDVSLLEYVQGLWQLKALVKLMSLCVFTNLLVFWGFLWMKCERAARGVLGATLLYAFVVLFSKAF